MTLETELLTAPSPFDMSDTLTACPTCKEVNDFYEVCDEPGCTREAGCGFPAGPEFGGYRRTCFEHSQWSQALPDNVKVTGAARLYRAASVLTAGLELLCTRALPIGCMEQYDTSIS